MVAIKVTIHSTGNGMCALTQKEGDGLSVSMDDGTVKEQFLSWRAFRQLLAMKSNQGLSPTMPTTMPTTPKPAPVLAPAAAVPLSNGTK